ncbi:MAG: hypothetical protein GY749_03145 [Desulfobacteraceae bacterium]|nr:hypothetical protein [Desulfobacteraceae bacterium]
MHNFFPLVLAIYLSFFRPAFYRPGWLYFQGFIWAMLISKGRKCVTQTAGICTFVDRSLSSWERFLAEQQ